MIDITNPKSPQIVGSVDTPGNAYDVAISGTFAYVADSGSGLQVLPLQCDVIDCNGNGIDDQTEIANHPSIDWNNDGIIDNCQQGEGIVGIPTATAIQVVLHAAAPNPFNPQTTIAFELPAHEAVSLRVFDVAGRLVKTMIDGEVYDQGHHEAVWNGRDDGGRQLASGTYFYRLETGEFSETKRMVLLK